MSLTDLAPCLQSNANTDNTETTNTPAIDNSHQMFENYLKIMLLKILRKLSLLAINLFKHMLKLEDQIDCVDHQEIMVTVMTTMLDVVYLDYE